MSFEEWYDQHFGAEIDKESAKKSAATAEVDPERLDYDPEHGLQGVIGSAFQSVRDAPGWAARRIARGINPDLPPARTGWDDNWSFQRALQNSGEGPSAREASVPMEIPPPPGSQDWSLQRAVQNFHPINDITQWAGYAMQPGSTELPPSPPGSWGGPSTWDRFKNDVSPPNLMRATRQHFLPDKDLEAIKRDPWSLTSLASYPEIATGLGIMLSRGAGGEEIPLGKPGAIPEHIWNTFKPGDPLDPKIKMDNAGNLFEYQGSHKVVDPETGKETYHVIAKPVDQSATTEGLTKSIEAQNTGIGPMQDNPFYKFLTGKEPPNPAIKSWQEGLESGDITQAQYDAAVDAINKGEMPPLPGNQPKPEPGSPIDEWMKKHGGQNPFEPPPSIGDDFPEMPPGVKPGEYWPQPEPMPSDKPEGYWGNLNDPKYYDRKMSGPLTGQQWADIYATPDVDFTVGPKPDDLTSYNPRNPPNLPPPPEPDLSPEGLTKSWEDILKPQDPFDNMLSDWAKYMDEKGIDYGQNEPPDPQIQADFDKIRRWQDKQNFLKNRFNWKPPEHGGNNL